MFIITAVLMTITVGLFIALLTPNGIKKIAPRVIAIILVSSMIGCGIAGLFWMEYKNDEQSWNGGLCPCGEEWRLVNVEHTKNGSDFYYYTCDECNNTIRTHSNMK